MRSLEKSIHASWMKGKEGNIAKDVFSLRQLTYDVGDGKEQIGNGPELRKYTFESLSLFRSGMGTISSLTRKLYEDGEEVFTLEIFVIPKDKDIPNAKVAGAFVVYDQKGNMIHKPNFEFGIGGSENIYEYYNNGFPNLSYCPEKINFKKTVSEFIRQARKPEFHNPRLFKANILTSVFKSLKIKS